MITSLKKKSCSDFKSLVVNFSLQSMCFIESVILSVLSLQSLHVLYSVKVLSQILTNAHYSDTLNDSGKHRSIYCDSISACLQLNEGNFVFYSPQINTNFPYRICGRTIYVIHKMQIGFVHKVFLQHDSKNLGI